MTMLPLPRPISSCFNILVKAMYGFSRLWLTKWKQVQTRILVLCKNHSKTESELNKFISQPDNTKILFVY